MSSPRYNRCKEPFPSFLLHAPMVDLHNQDHQHLHFSSVSHHAYHEVYRLHADKHATTHEVMSGSTDLQTKLFTFQSETHGDDDHNP